MYGVLFFGFSWEYLHHFKYKSVPSALSDIAVGPVQARRQTDWTLRFTRHLYLKREYHLDSRLDQ